MEGDLKVSNLEKNVQWMLISLLVLDIVLSCLAFFAPGFWFWFFHQTPYGDPQGLLRRCGANWAAFALFQALALVLWKKRLHWLVLAAGLRFSDIFTDWAYLRFCGSITPWGAVGLFLAGPANLFCGVYLLRAYGILVREGRTGGGPV